MQKGNINVTTENIFPLIKKFLYSEEEIFLRELISNAVDATQKLKALERMGEYNKKIEDETINVSVDKKKKTITVSDHGLGMTADEVKKYINEIAFSSAEEFLKKFKDKDKSSIIGHFGLGFYSSFMVAKKVEIFSKSYKKNAKAVRWECEGTPEYKIEDAKKEDIGTDVVIHVGKDYEEYLEESKINELLNKYSKFLPIPIAFGEEKEWKDGKEKSTGKPKIINNTKPAWTIPPAELKDEDYKKFYKELYPDVFEEPLFNIHLNVDYPFKLTGILYFPKIKNKIEVQKNKIQLYSNQVFVTDSVEDIVPEFLTLLHGVLDSPDIPLNVSRSYLQSDSNVRKISNHITKKVADKLEEIFKNDRKQFEEKWNDVKIFIQYGILTDEKFYERANKFTLLTNTEQKYFTIDEYKELVKDNQTDKDKNVVFLYSTDREEQYTYIEKAKDKGYDVLLMDGQLDTHFVNHMEQKLDKINFVRVDADVVDKLIKKEDEKQTDLEEYQQEDTRQVILSRLPADKTFMIQFEALGKEEQPMIITQSEFMRRMKDMQEMGGSPMGMYGNMPDSYNLVVNTDHKLVNNVIKDKDKTIGEEVEKIRKELEPVKKEMEDINTENKDKKDEEIPQEKKDKLEELQKKETEILDKKNSKLKDYGKKNDLVKQMTDLALLANNMLKGEDLAKFVKRSVKFIK